METSWSIRTPKKLACLDINDTLSEIIQILKPKQKVIQEILDKLSITCIFVVEIDIGKEGFPAVYLERSAIDFLYSIKAEIGLDVFPADFGENRPAD